MYFYTENGILRLKHQRGICYFHLCVADSILFSFYKKAIIPSKSATFFYLEIGQPEYPTFLLIPNLKKHLGKMHKKIIAKNCFPKDLQKSVFWGLTFIQCTFLKYSFRSLSAEYSGFLTPMLTYFEMKIFQHLHLIFK
jgi:hypothetical protein